MRELREIISRYAALRGEPMALATLVRQQGSSYRQPGARVLVVRDRPVAGSLSGGCLEEEVAQRAAQVIRSRHPALMHFDTRARFGCHGAIDVFIEPDPGLFLEDLAHAVRARRGCMAITTYGHASETGSRVLADLETVPPSAFAQWIAPGVRLILIGHGPEAEALANFAKILGWQIEGYDSAAELAGPLDERTAVVVGTHHYGRDFAAVRAVAEYPLPYVGLVGSRRRRDQLFADLADAGVDCGTVFGPAGLDLGAESPEQIALAIVAEIQAVFGHGSAHSLRNRSGAIHRATDGFAQPLLAGQMH